MFPERMWRWIPFLVLRVVFCFLSSHRYFPDFWRGGERVSETEEGWVTIIGLRWRVFHQCHSPLPLMPPPSPDRLLYSTPSSSFLPTPLSSVFPFLSSSVSLLPSFHLFYLVSFLPTLTSCLSLPLPTPFLYLHLVTFYSTPSSPLLPPTPSFLYSLLVHILLVSLSPPLPSSFLSCLSFYSSLPFLPSFLHPHSLRYPLSSNSSCLSSFLTTF